MSWLLLSVLATALLLAQPAAASTEAERKAESEQAGVQRHPAGDEYDYFMFVRQWPGAFCNQHACPMLKDPSWYRFTIHGLWPNYNDGSWPQFCDSSKPFDEDLVDDLLPEMDEDWPSFMGANEGFWSHEWNKHGTCALRELPSEHSFFKTVLALHHKLDLKEAFAAAGIEPSSRRTYKKADLLAAIQAAFGVQALLHCTAEGQLSEVWMCVGKDLSPQDCTVPAGDASHCREITIKPLHEGGDHEGWGVPPPSAASRLAALPAAERAGAEAESGSREGDTLHDTAATTPRSVLAVVVLLGAVLSAALAMSWMHRNPAAAPAAGVPGSTAPEHAWLLPPTRAAAQGAGDEVDAESGLAAVQPASRALLQPLLSQQ